MSQATVLPPVTLAFEMPLAQVYAEDYGGVALAAG
jgi:hypothetical protein